MQDQQIDRVALARGLLLQQTCMSVMPFNESLVAFLDQLLGLFVVALLRGLDGLDVAAARRADGRDDLECREL